MPSSQTLVDQSQILPRLSGRKNSGAKVSAASLRRMRWKEVVILLNGGLPGAGAVRRLVRSGVPLVCTDGGAGQAADWGLEPRIVIGDMDSLPRRLPRWRRTLFLCDFGEDSSDFEKALRFVARGGAHAVWVAGWRGGRLDHELVNWALLETYSERLSIRLVADAGRPRLECARILGLGSHSLRCRRGETVTLLSITPSAQVTVTGFLYPLSHSFLRRGSRGLSNVALHSTLRVRVHSGRVWFVTPLACSVQIR